MENKFKNISRTIYSQLKKDELLTLSFTGEESQFIRLNNAKIRQTGLVNDCLLYTSPSPRDATLSRMPSSA